MKLSFGVLFFSIYIKKLDLQVLKNRTRVSDPVPVQQIFLYRYFLELKTRKFEVELEEKAVFLLHLGTCE